MMSPATRLDLAFRALADPTRRQALELLADGERPVRELHGRFSMSQPALSQHLAVLREAGLVRVRRQGRLRVYSVDPQPLRELYQWVRRTSESAAPPR
jgi:DNA-binding transcriptional ArsR family regulator